MSAYRICRTEGHTYSPPHRGTAVAVRSPVLHKKQTYQHFTVLEVTAVNIPTRTESLTIGAVYAPPSPGSHDTDPSTSNALYLQETITLSIRCGTLV
jgi:hypothetical protein